MKILVTGGCGLIGSHLCEKLLNEQHEVVCLDNLFTGSTKNIKHLLANEKFTFIEHDIINPIMLNADQIYHLACPASPKYYQQDPIATMKTSIFGSLTVLNMAKENNSTVLLASTSEIYGEPQIFPQTEDYRGNVSSTGIRACYDEGKRSAETLFMDYNRMYNVNTHIARIFNTYGPRLSRDDGRVVSNFVTQALDNLPITIYGRGTQTRSFCYVDDTVNGLVKLMNSSLTFPVNIGNPNEITVTTLAHAIIKLTNSKSTLIEQPLPQDDPTRRQPCIKRALELLNWKPTTKLETGLQKTIDHFRDASI